MPKNFDITQDFAYGDMNPILPKPGKVYRDNETSGIEVMAQTAAESYEIETILGTGPYKAICLRLESSELAGGARPNGGGQKMSWLDRIYASTGLSPSDKTFTEVKATIPEIHGAMLPPPKSYDDHSAINKFPTFIARQANMPDTPPEPGDIIWVDFGNRITLQDPQYLGKIVKDASDKPLDDDAANTWPCGTNALITTAPNGDIIKSTKEPVAKVGPTMAPDYQPIDIELERGKIPRGKGVFLRGSLTPLKLSDYPIKTAKDAGISWVNIWVYKILKNGTEVIRDIGSIKTFIDEYHKNGIKCYIYGWAAIGAGKGYNEAAFKKQHNGQEPEDMFIKNMINIATETGAMGVDIDAEEDCHAKGTSVENTPGKYSYSTEVVERNETFARKLSEQCKNYKLSFGYTSTTPASWSIKSGHYFKSWGKYCDYVIPQTYSATGFHGPIHWKKGYNNYAAEGFKNIIPGMGAYDVGPDGAKQPKLPDRMRWELHQCYNQGLGWADAIIWWAWPQLDQRNRWSVVKELASGIPQSTEEPEEEVVNASTPSNTGQQSTPAVSPIGPIQAQAPATGIKAKSAEVVTKNNPQGTSKQNTGKTLELAKESKTRDFSKHPIVRADLLAFTSESPKEIDRLLEVTGKQAQISAAPEDQQKIEELKAEAEKNILNILEPGTPESKIKLLETQIVGLRKDLKAISNSGTTTNAGAKIKNEIINKENEIKSLLESQKAPAPPLKPCPPAGVVGAGGQQAAGGSGNPVMSTAATTVLLETPVPHKENRVRASVYGYIARNSPLMVDTGPSKKKPGHYNRKLHVLAAKRWNAMNAAWVKESKQPPMMLLQGWATPPSQRYRKLRRPPFTGGPPEKLVQKWQPMRQLLIDKPDVSLYDLWLSWLKEEYRIPKGGGAPRSDKEALRVGRKFRGWYSAHCTGLAVDIYYEDNKGKKMRARSAHVAEMQSMELHKWLVKNAHLYGWSPYTAEPWHWECQIPLKAYATGQEFTKNMAVRVKETSIKTGLDTSYYIFAKKAFT